RQIFGDIILYTRMPRLLYCISTRKVPLGGLWLLAGLLVVVVLIQGWLHMRLATPWEVPVTHPATHLPAQKLELNTAGREQLMALPCIGPARARRILQYRARRWLHSPEELFSIYGLDSCREALAHRVYVDADTLQQLQAEEQVPPVHSPRINLNMAEAADLVHPQLLTAAQARRLVQLRSAEGAFTDFEQLSHRTEWDARTVRNLARNTYCGKYLAKVNLNTADSSQLEGIPGIGPRLAGRIPRYRQALGFFHSPAQLREVYGMRPEHYTRLLPYVYADVSPGAARLHINTATATQLRRHPYFREKALLDTLLVWRSQQESITGLADWYKAPLPAEWLQKTAPYLRFD
ncbi:MAG: helix-hairpin-helix domain-containing protein, partial [Bacteroidetes bacterium]|nr:helix-hairpin-helix domain-containing protein [Bacteroidota bacterium]